MRNNYKAVISIEKNQMLADKLRIQGNFCSMYYIMTYSLTLHRTVHLAVFYWKITKSNPIRSINSFSPYTVRKLTIKQLTGYYSIIYSLLLIQFLIIFYSV